MADRINPRLSFSFEKTLMLKFGCFLRAMSIMLISAAPLLFAGEESYLRFRNIETDAEFHLFTTGKLVAKGLLREKQSHEKLKSEGLIFERDKPYLAFRGKDILLSGTAAPEVLMNALPGDFRFDYDEDNDIEAFLRGNASEATIVLNTSGDIVLLENPISTVVYVDGLGVFEQYGTDNPDLSFAYANISGDGKEFFESNHTTGQRHFYIKDHLGSTHMVVGDSPDAVEIFENLAYQAYGSMENFSTGLPTNEAREKFTGKEFDTEVADPENGVEGIGAYHFKFRGYDPVIGMWLRPDPVDQQWHSYAYCGGNPIVFVDPLGLYFDPDQTEEEEKLFSEWTEEHYDEESGKGDSEWEEYENFATDPNTEYSFSEYIRYKSGNQPVIRYVPPQEQFSWNTPSDEGNPQTVLVISTEKNQTTTVAPQTRGMIFGGPAVEVGGFGFGVGRADDMMGNAYMYWNITAPATPYSLLAFGVGIEAGGHTGTSSTFRGYSVETTNYLVPNMTMNTTVVGTGDATSHSISGGVGLTVLSSKHAFTILIPLKKYTRERGERYGSLRYLSGGYVE